MSLYAVGPGLYVPAPMALTVAVDLDFEQVRARYRSDPRREVFYTEWLRVSYAELAGPGQPSRPIPATGGHSTSEFYSVADVERDYRIPARTVRRYAKAMGGVRLGHDDTGPWCFERTEVERWVKEREETA